MLGGGMRQVGILAAAGLYALEHQVPRLEEDHRRAKRLREALSEIGMLKVDQSPLQTNMVLLQIDGSVPSNLVEGLKAQGIIVSDTGSKMRLVVHRDIDDHGIDRVIAGFNAAF
jgi:threonine aldolase